MDIKEKIGLKIKKFRNLRKLSQEELSFISNLDRTYISSIEKGRRNVSIVNMEKLAKALNIKLKDIFEDI